MTPLRSFEWNSNIKLQFEFELEIEGKENFTRFLSDFVTDFQQL